jgi:hypothetical protein
LAETYERPLRDAGGEFRHILAAEGVATRTTRWTLTGNVRGAQQGSSMKGHLIELRHPNRKSIDQILADEGERVLAQLRSIDITAD